MDTLAKLNKLFRHISEHGTKRDIKHQMGGIWSADIWDLNGFVAQQTDDGVTLVVGDANGLIGFSEYGRSIQYWRGRTEADILAVYQAFFPDNA